MTERDFTPTEAAMPPKDAQIEWVAPDGQVVAGKWLGGAVWMPSGSKMYVYYRPAFWRLA
jgi:hypothetical protein